MSVLEKIEVLGSRQMIELGTQTTLSQVTKPTNVVGRTESRKCCEIANEVRLIKVSVV